MSDYLASVAPLDDMESLGREWRELQAQADCSFFQSWGWISNWLTQVVADLDPVVVRVHQAGMLVGLGILVHGRIGRRAIIRSDALYLNEYPHGGRNMSTEYNGVLAPPRHLAAVYRAISCHAFNSDSRLDELYFGAVDSAQFPRELLENMVCERARPDLLALEASRTWAVSLDRLEQGREAFLASLSKNRRTQIRRSFRLYETGGPLRLELANDASAALEFLEGLKRLHTLRWQQAGKQGVFANPVWERFHHALITTRFADGEVQLLRVCNDAQTVGYLYNLVWRDHVYVLQTGFQAATEKGMMPGYVVHVMAIEHYRAAGCSCYDLMHGDELYKRILCKPYRKLEWLVLQRPRLRFRIEQALLALKRRIVPARKPVND